MLLSSQLQPVLAHYVKAKGLPGVSAISGAHVEEARKFAQTKIGAAVSAEDVQAARDAMLSSVAATTAKLRASIDTRAASAGFGGKALSASPAALGTQTTLAVGRTWRQEDTTQLQNAFIAWRKGGGDAFVLGRHQYYTFTETGVLSEKRGADTEPLSAAGKKAYETLLLGTFNRWAENAAKNQAFIAQAKPAMAADSAKWRPATSIDDMRDKLRTGPYAGAGVVYQNLGEQGSISNPFVFFESHRLNAYNHAKKEVTTRLYLNPPKEALPLLAGEVIKRAQAAEVPYSFKIMDFSLDHIQPDAGTRRDRMVMYTDGPTSERLLGILGDIRKEHPDWFKSRPLPVMTRKAGEGVGIAHEPSEDQHKRFSGMGEKQTSFSSVRAQMLEALSLRVTKDILIRVPKFRDVLTRQAGKELTLADLDRALKNDLDGARTFTKQDWVKQRAFERALEKCVPEVLSAVTPDSLHQWLQARLPAIAAEYGVDPKDLSANAAGA